MKRMMRRGMSLGLAGMMALSMAACGSSSSDTATTAAGTTAAAAADTTAASGDADSSDGAPVTIKFTWWGNQSRHEYTQKILDKYTELHPNVTFEALPNGWDGYFDKLSTQAASGSMPDVVAMDYLYITTYAKDRKRHVLSAL